MISVVYFVTASERGTKPGEIVLLLVSDPSELMDNSVTDLEPVFPTKMNFPPRSATTKTGFVPTLTEAVVKAVNAPVVLSILNCEMLPEPELAT
jgi:hypothetical protein